MRRYSVFALAREALRHHSGWGRAWGAPEPRASYQVVIVGAGGHGLATAYYLAKNHGITDVAVLEKGWLGGGNTGRNTTIIRSNYLQPSSAAIYEKARRLYEDLSQQLNFNVMFSPRGVLMLAQTEHELRAWKRTAHANRLAGIESELVDRDADRPDRPDPEPRRPALPGARRPLAAPRRHRAPRRGGLGLRARRQRSRRAHPAELRGDRHRPRRRTASTGVRTTRGPIRCASLCLVVAGSSGVLADMAGFRLPIESVALQALVSEPIKPLLDCVVMANTVHGYVSPVRQGRDGDRRRRRRLQQLHPARQLPAHRGDPARPDRDLPGAVAA